MKNLREITDTNRQEQIRANAIPDDGGVATLRGYICHLYQSSGYIVNEQQQDVDVLLLFV
jgi:hypothetical protein